MSDSPQDLARVRLKNGIHQIEQALRDWQNQASDAIDAWDGNGDGPAFYAAGIRDLIDASERNIRMQVERMISNAQDH